MTTVYFVRHAKSDKNVRDDTTRPLTAEGLADSHKVTQLLADRKIDVILSSPYKRTIDTVADLAQELNIPVITDENFRERNAGGWHGDNFLEFIRAQWNDREYRMNNGECIRQVQQRNIAALGRALDKYSGKTIVIATHGTALSTIINYYNPQFGFEDFMRIIDFMPYVIKAEFDGKRLIGLTEELIVEKEY